MSQTASKKVCAGCNKPLFKTDFMSCPICRAAYDLECINMSTQHFNSLYKQDKRRRDGWRCPQCVSSKPKSGNQNTPVRPAQSPEHSINVTQRRPTPKVLSDSSPENVGMEEDHGFETSANLKVQFKQFLEEMRAIRNEMSMFRGVISDLTATINSQNVRLQALENRVEKLESGTGVPGSHAISNLQDTITQLKLEIDDRDQQMLENDVEIANYPECVSPAHAILTVAKILGVELGKGDIVSASRMGAPPPDASKVSTIAPKNRPRPIAVRLARRDQRDALLQAARVRRRLTVPADDVDVASASPPQFYINERLTRRNRQLFLRARQAAKQVHWKFVWTRDGRIFARPEHGGSRYRLRSEADLSRVFGAENVSDPNVG